MKQDAKILDSEGITPPEVKDIVQDFQDQTLLNPRVKNIVGHISLSFSERDKDKLTDKAMTEIAKEYMQKMGINRPPTEKILPPSKKSLWRPSNAPSARRCGISTTQNTRRLKPPLMALNNPSTTLKSQSRRVRSTTITATR
jgi:hypothetical protein